MIEFSVAAPGAPRTKNTPDKMTCGTMELREMRTMRK